MQKQQEYVTFQSAYESSVTAQTHRDFSAEIYDQDIFAQALQGSNSRINIPSVTFNQPHLPTICLLTQIYLILCTRLEIMY